MAFAKDHSLRQIEQAVSQAAYGDRPPRDAYSLSKAKFKVIAALPMEDYAVWKAAFERIAETSGLDLDSATALLILAKTFIERPLNKNEQSARKAFQVVYHRCTDCHNAWLQTNDGPQGIPVSKVAERERQAAVVRLDGARERVNGSRKKVPRGTLFCDDRIFCTAKSIDKPNTSRILQQVLSRDGQQCATPGFQNRGGELFAHHVVWRSRGGGTNLVNEVSACQTCHSLIHDGLLSVSGEAPLRLNWLASDGKVIENVEKAESSSHLRYRRVVRAGVPRGAQKSADDGLGSSGGGAEEKPVIYSLDEIPDRVYSA